jgi:predicted metal-binding membrane protein
VNVARFIAWRYPHWWAFALSAGAWWWLAARWWRTSHDHAQAGGFALVDWSLMVVAMMMPLVFAHMRFAAARSLWGRRQRAVIAFAFGYLATWLLTGLLLSALVSGSVVRHFDFPWMAAAAFGTASLWQLVPFRRRALAACDRTMPLAPRGWRADRDCLRFGWSVGIRCVVACGALMMACVFAGHSVLAMICASAVAMSERYGARVDERAMSGALALVGVWFAV